MKTRRLVQKRPASCGLKFHFAPLHVRITVVKSPKKEFLSQLQQNQLIQQKQLWSIEKYFKTTKLCKIFIKHCYIFKYQPCHTQLKYHIVLSIDRYCGHWLNLPLCHILYFSVWIGINRLNPKLTVFCNNRFRWGYKKVEEEGICEREENGTKLKMDLSILLS